MIALKIYTYELVNIYLILINILIFFFVNKNIYFNFLLKLNNNSIL